MKAKSCIAMALTAVLLGCQQTAVKPSPETPVRTLVVAVTTPDAGWQVQIERILERDTEVWVLAQLERRPGPAAQMIQVAKADLPIPLPNKPLRIFIAGKTWAWPNDEPYEFVPSLEVVARRASGARVLYSREKKG